MACEGLGSRTQESPRRRGRPTKSTPRAEASGHAGSEVVAAPQTALLDLLSILHQRVAYGTLGIRPGRTLRRLTRRSQLWSTRVRGGALPQPRLIGWGPTWSSWRRSTS